jgi:DtxR family Mn-dependent transcriptional regulator
MAATAHGADKPVASAHGAHRERRNAEGAENYAKALYQLQARVEPGELVGTGAVAERLGVTPASASAMLKRLASEGLVDYKPYRGARLTDDGEQLALEMIRHHRLIELFLAEVLGMPWDRVHDEAEVLEHHISEELEELIAEKLGQPLRDPHGDPIPSRDLSILDDSSRPLSELAVGQSATMVRVSDRDGEMLRYGPVFARFDSGEEVHVLGGALARAMRVEAAV